MKLYVLVRKDISLIQRAVQAGHAIAEYLQEYPDTTWDNGVLVYLGVENEKDLKYWEGALAREGIPSSMFYEPDIVSFTSLSFVLGTGEHKRFRRHLGSSLKLLIM